MVDDATSLRLHGLQVTAQRLAVLRAVADHPHGTADVVEAEVRERLGAVSRQAVYDALGVLADKGVIRRIQPAGSPARYERRVGDNHHHLICRSCRRMIDVDCAVGYTPCLTPSDGADFEVDEAEVVYWGRCPDCLGRDRPPSTSTSPSTNTNTKTPRERTTRRGR
ncbi:MAG TPA: Fur family transcriptional regulator [Acidimicrobiales bacterium]|nr:Fur family transcriptional regulator [Acidimicrobiales bacterium]